MGTFSMPSLGADMEAGTLVEWLKHPGDRVERGDTVAVVETQKGAIEVEVFEAGVIDRLLVEPGTTVPVGTPMALVRGPGEEAIEAPAPELVSAEAVALPAPSVHPAPPPSAPAAEAPGRPRASPAARRFARERGLDLAGMTGTGPGGAVVSTDIERSAAIPASAPHPMRGLDLTEMRRAIANAMARSKREIPHYYLSTTIDLTRAQAFLERINAERQPADRLLLPVLQLKAVALALRRMPEFNGFHTADGFQPGTGIHVGTAIAIRGGGLATPAIHDTDRLSLDALMAHLRDLVARTRVGRLRSSELSDATITVTSLGDRGVESVFGVIYPPQVAIVGFGKPVERPWVAEGRIAIRLLSTTTLAADHRVSDGHKGGLFLAEIDRHLQEPEKL
ncbi:pyruvate dehydrogenase E2 component (dihydrolipoamide acetyltransferase) [Skermanella aerolata]|uniref:dihydrolipoamide acetyltransferase family protein n=1 Tax=Skermanella aerolata TaxID=393310 RepID=UPI003D24C629